MPFTWSGGARAREGEEQGDKGEKGEEPMRTKMPEYEEFK